MADFEKRKINPNEFPFLIEFCRKKEPQKERPNHLHNVYEIIYVHSGVGMFFIDDHFYEMEKGNVFFIPSSTIHRAKPDPDNLVTCTVLFFGPSLIPSFLFDNSYSFSSLFKWARQSRTYKLSLAPDDQVDVETLLNRIYQEYSDQMVGAEHAILLAVHQLLLHLYRISLTLQDDTSVREPIEPFWMNEILHFIDQNISEPLSLSSLANEALVSTAHFSRVFKQRTGIGLTSYINQKRTLKAKELLLQSGETIASIAEQIGFDSLPHFYRTFKNYTGCTPADYRRDAQKETLRLFKDK